MHKFILIIGLLIGLQFAAMAQNSVVPATADSLQQKKDTVKAKSFVPKISTPRVYHPDSTHSPSKAWHRSVAIPGWGQVYNKRIWKVPVIYTGLTLLVLMYRFNQHEYSQFLGVAKYRSRGYEPKVGEAYYDLYQQVVRYPDQSINDLVRNYARYRDLSVLLLAASWGIQTIDAYVDAKFRHSYSMDDNFSVKVMPTLMNNQPMMAQSLSDAFIPGLKVTFTLR